jgi:hypothetical protein
MGIDQTLLYMQVLAAITALLNFSETFFASANYKPGSIYDWNVLRTNLRVTTTGVLSKVGDALFRYEMFLALVLLQGLSAIVLLLNIGGSYTLFFLVLLTICFVLYNVRNSFGQDGSDQMLTIVLICLCLAHAASSTLIKQMAIWFVCAQSLLSYLTAGFSKLAGKTWRNGSALIGINRTDAYGAHKLFFWFRQRPAAAKFMCWVIIVCECLCPALVLLGRPWVFIFLGMSVLFHLIIAVGMRLNTFFWAFLAALPAVLHVSDEFFN